MTHLPDATRYDRPGFYRRCGRSGISLPLLSLGLWHNFGTRDSLANARAMLRRAFDLGITHFDLANNYGPPPGSARRRSGGCLREELGPYRDELVISSKAGCCMWPGPYGDLGSRKYLVATLDQSLRRMGLDSWTSSIPPAGSRHAAGGDNGGAGPAPWGAGGRCTSAFPRTAPGDGGSGAAPARELGTPCLVHQPRYSMLDRLVETERLFTRSRERIGAMVFSPLAQGALTDRYSTAYPTIRGHVAIPVPADRPCHRPGGRKAGRFREVAQNRGQTMAQMALAWVLRLPVVTTALIGASRVSQLEDCVGATRRLALTRRSWS